jgi:hypothetical protein
MISKKRLEMGEEKWKEYQRERNSKKIKRYYEAHPEKKNKRDSYTTYWRIRTKQRLINYKVGKCELCGYSKNSPSAYDFHHINPEDKSFTISKYAKLKFDVLRKEVDKCMLLCCRCHAELHDKERECIREKAFRIGRNKELV